MLRNKEITEEFRGWLAKMLDEIGTNQTTVAKKAGVSPSWTSQLMNGKRKRCERDNMIQLKQSLLSLIADNTKIDQQAASQAVQVQFSPFIEPDEIGFDYSVDAMRVCADVLEIINQKCPSKLMRRRVVEFLKVAVEE